MVERRTLTEGLKATPPVAPEVAKRFISGDSDMASAAAANPAVSSTSSQALNRVPISTRIRGDFAAALKRASLERQLNAVEPNTLQDILEEAIEPWLKANGYFR
jgi:hypothetical protein